MLDRHIAGGNGGRACDIHRPGTGIRRPREIQRQRLTLDHHFKTDPQRDVADAVIVEEILGGITAVGQLTDQTAELQGRTALQLDQCVRHRGIAIFIQQGMQAADAEIERIHLPVHVAIKTVGQARIGTQNVDHILAQLAGGIELHRRNDHAFLEAFRRHRIVITRHIATDIMPVPDRSEVAEDLVIAEEGPHQLEIAQMRAAVVGVIEDIDIAVLQGASSFAALSITALTAKAMAPTKIGRPDFPCTRVSPVTA